MEYNYNSFFTSPILFELLDGFSYSEARLHGDVVPPNITLIFIYFFSKRSCYTAQLYLFYFILSVRQILPTPTYSLPAPSYKILISQLPWKKLSKYPSFIKQLWSFWYSTRMRPSGSHFLKFENRTAWRSVYKLLTGWTGWGSSGL